MFKKIIAILGITLLFLFIMLMTLRALYPWQYDYVEGLTLYISFLLKSGANVYSPTPEKGGFTAASYPVLAYLPGLVSIHFNKPNILYITRFFYILSSILSLMTLYYFFSNRDTWRWFLSIMIVNMFVAFTYWSSLIRSDILALPFILLYLVSLRNNMFVYSTILGIIALNIKQQYLYLLFYPLILWFLTKDGSTRRKLLLSTIMLGMGVVLVYIVQESFFPGFFKTIFLYNMVHEKELGNAINIFKNTFMNSLYTMIVLVVGVLSAVSSIYRKGREMDLSIVFLLSFFISFITSMKLGSNTNYYILPIVLSSIIIVYNIPSPRELVYKHGFLKKIFVTTLLVVIFISSVYAVMQSYGFTTEFQVEGYCISDVLMNINESSLWTDDYYIAFISHTSTPVDSFYYSRLVEKNVVGDVNEWSVKPDTIIWSYNPYRITPWIEENLGSYYKTVLIGEAYGVYTHNSYLEKVFHEKYGSCYSTMVSRIQVLKNRLYPSYLNEAKILLKHLLNLTTVFLVFVLIAWFLEGDAIWRGRR